SAGRAAMRVRRHWRGDTTRWRKRTRGGVVALVKAPCNAGTGRPAQPHDPAHGGQAPRATWAAYGVGVRAVRPGHCDVIGEVCGSPGLSDEKVLERCRSNRDSERFQQVYDDGDLRWFGYDDSAADWFIWGRLVFYCGDNVEQIMRLAERGEHYQRSDDPSEAK